MPKIFATNNVDFNNHFEDEYVNLLDQTEDSKIQVVTIGLLGDCSYAVVQSNSYRVYDRITNAYDHYYNLISQDKFNCKKLNLFYREKDFDDFGHSSYITTVNCQMKGYELEMIYREFELNQTGRNSTKLLWTLSLDEKYYVLFTDKPVSGYDIGVIRGFLYGLIYKLKMPLDHMNDKGCVPACRCKEIRNHE